ncbi:MAG: VWA domain-containing protein [Anaerolineae bacterium]|nr:VWA domain-containing protein [Anaerolineae bacterium]
MTFLNPDRFLALLLALPILALYFLRLQRREALAPSTLLWKAAISERHAHRPWQKLRRNWMLLLQLLTLALLVIAGARPAIPARQALGGQVVVLLDVSASMQAPSPTGATRCDAARQALRDLSGTLAPEDSVSLVAVGPEPAVLLRDGSPVDFRRLLDDVVPTDGVADWNAAAMLSHGLARAADMTTLIVSDRAIDENLPGLPGAVRLLDVGGMLPNSGIVGFSARRSTSGLSALVRVRNAGPEVRRAVTLLVDDIVWERRWVDLEQDVAVALSFDNLPDGDWLEVHLEAPEQADPFPLDDRAWVALQPQQDGRVLLLTSGNRFLEQALRALPGIDLEQTGDAVVALAAHHDLFVVDADPDAALSSWPAANVWAIAPLGVSPCGTAGLAFEPEVGATRVNEDHALLRYVDWFDVHITRAYDYDLPPGADVLIENAGRPLLWTLTGDGRKTICQAFDFHDSDLPLRVAFPVLAANLVRWSLPQLATEPVTALPPGAPWYPSLPPEALAASLERPGGLSLPLLDTQLAPPLEAGLYPIQVALPDTPAVQYVAFSLLDDGESDLRPRSFRVGGREVASILDPGWHEQVKGLLILALLLLLLEAWLWWRRDLIPGGTALWLQNLPALLRAHPVAVVTRLTMIALVVAALFDVRGIRKTRDLSVVFVVDRSDSMAERWRDALTFVTEALSGKPARDQAALVVFGGVAWVERGLTSSPTLSPLTTRPSPDATDIEAALDLALGLIPDGAPGRVVLFTDGIETTGAARQALLTAGTRDIDVVVIDLGAGESYPELWIDDVRLPQVVFVGDRVPVAVTVGSERISPASLVWNAGPQGGEMSLNLADGVRTFLLSFTAEDAGFVPFKVCVAAVEDTFAQNNCAHGWIIVAGPDRVLVIGEAEERAYLEEALRQAGLDVAGVVTGDAPLTPSTLSAFSAIVLVNTPARSLTAQRMEALHEYVRDFGGALVAVGGSSSYGVGGWLGTPLEEVLPVEMRVQDPRRFPPMTMILVIDTSGSMAEPDAGSGGTPKVRLAAEAAARVAESLNDTDTMAVVAYEDRPADVVGPVSLAERDALVDRLMLLQAGGGGIYVRDSLAFAAQLFESDASVAELRHIVLLADSSDAEQQGGALELAASLRDAGITLSVVAIGSGTDVNFLQSLAASGEGRFYLASQAADLPAIFSEEAYRARRSYIVEGAFDPEVVTSWAPLQSFSAVPPVLGYVATTPKDTAQLVWSVDAAAAVGEAMAVEDPLLAVWRHGLGHAVAWTSGASGQWGREWVAWDAFAQFWGNIVRWIARPDDDAGVTLHLSPAGDAGELMAIVDVVDPAGGYVDGLNLTLEVGGGGKGITLSPTAPGRYEGTVVSQGAEAFLVRVTGDRSLTTGWALPYAAEYLPTDPARSLESLVSGTDARLVDAPMDPFTHDRVGYRAGGSISAVLILLAAMLWPVDVAIRRLHWTWRRRHSGAREHKEQSALPSSLAAHLRCRVRPTPAGVQDTGNEPEEGIPEFPGASSDPVEGSGDPGIRDATLASRLRRRLRDTPDTDSG